MFTGKTEGKGLINKIMEDPDERAIAQRQGSYSEYERRGVWGSAFWIGEVIRDRFGFWEGNPQLLLDCAEDAGRDIQYADEASSVIIGRLALELGRTHKLRSV